MIHTAPERYETVCAALRYRGDGTTIKAIRERMVRSDAGRRAFRLSAREASEPVKHPEPDGLFGWHCRAWQADHHHWRMETALPDGGTHILASAGRRRLPIGGPPGSGLVWQKRIGGGPRDEDPRWLSPAFDHYWTFYPLCTDEICGISYELAEFDLRVEERTSWAGREAVRLVGVPPVVEQEWDPDPLSWGADEYDLLVDVERGIILRCANRLGGKDFDTLEVEEVFFDERFDRETFTSRRPLSW